jgi:hypothetical protein
MQGDGAAHVPVSEPTKRREFEPRLAGSPPAPLADATPIGAVGCGAMSAQPDSAWGQFSSWISQAGARVRVLPVEPHRGEPIARALGVSARSSLWAMATNVGALVIDDGWVRVLGGGTAGQRADLADWNGLSDAPTFARSVGFFVVGYDVMGGVFALDGGALSGGPGNGQVFYFAPDSLAWEPMEMGYTPWLQWLLLDRERVDGWFESQRWPGWRDEVRDLSLDTAVSAFPFAWTEEGKDPSRVHREPIAATSVIATTFRFARELENPSLPGPRPTSL